MTTRKYQKNKRPGSKRIQTKRSPKNKHRWETQVGYAVRLKYRALWAKVKLGY